MGNARDKLGGWTTQIKAGAARRDHADAYESQKFQQHNKARV